MPRNGPSILDAPAKGVRLYLEGDPHREGCRLRAGRRRRSDRREATCAVPVRMPTADGILLALAAARANCASMHTCLRIITCAALATALTTVSGTPLRAQGSELERQVFAARDTVWRAWFANDTALLARFLPPAIATLTGGADGLWQDRAAELEASRKSAREGRRLLGLRFENSEISATGLSVLVRSDFMTVTASGQQVDTTRGRATELFVKVGMTWTNPYWQIEPGESLSSVGREILLPDTLGANFAIADSAAMLGTPHDYDRLVGTWEFRFQNRRSPTAWWPVFTGHWTFDKRPGDGLVEDHWRPDDPSLPMGNSLYTYRIFDPERKVWQMIGASSRGGDIQPGLTWSDGGHRYVIQRNGDVLSRIRYFAIEPDRFLWRSDRSTDGGKTWLLDFGVMEARRIGR